ncbi:MAG: 50S ribosomal protein L7ae [Candidatus Diapherotrites archaeon]|nr:50S ribosomal protein L7ae [Candidatus Diapherotrites archaeon]
MAEFVKFSVPSEVEKSQAEFLEKIRKRGKIRVGANEVTKAIERQRAKAVFIAEDVTPPELVMHLPILCREKNIPFSYFKTRESLGKAGGIQVATSALAVVDEADMKKELEALLKRIGEIQKGD